MMILFVDFDGVIHPIPKPVDGLFCHLPRLERVLREFPNINVVVSSSWRETYPFDVVQGIFSEDLHSRIIDVTPSIPGVKRQAEVEAWLSENSYSEKWAVIDDQKDEFSDEFHPLFLCETTVGLDETSIEKFRLFLLREL